MWIVVYLLTLPYAADVAALDSPRWQVRERAAHRLEKHLPWSLAAVLPKPGDSAHVTRLKSRVRTSTWLGRQIARWWVAERRDQLLCSWVDEFKPICHEDDHGCFWYVRVNRFDNGEMWLDYWPRESQ